MKGVATPFGQNIVCSMFWIHVYELMPVCAKAV